MSKYTYDKRRSVQIKAYKTEIYPTKSQIELIHQTCGNVRYIYNRYISDNSKRLKHNEPVISGYFNHHAEDFVREGEIWIQKERKRLFGQYGR